MTSIHKPEFPERAKNEPLAVSKSTKSKPSRITREIILALKEGDHRAYDIVYLTYKESLKKFLLTLTGSQAQSEDIAQDAFEKLWKKRDKLNPDGNMKTYLYVIARNDAFNFLRSKKKFRDLPEESEWEELLDIKQPDQGMIAKDTQLMIEIVVSNMPEKRREVYHMHMSGKSYEEIADALSISQETARQHLSRARKEIQDHLLLLLIFLLP